MVKYNSFSNSKRKLVYLWDLNNTNQNTLSNQLDNQTVSETKIKKFQLENQELSNVIQLGSDWMDFDVISETISHVPVLIWKEWKIFIPVISEKTLQTLKIEMIYRVGETANLNKDLNEDITFAKYRTIQINDIIEGENKGLISVNIHSSIVLQNFISSDPINELQVKFLVSIINPILYQKF